MFTYKATSFSLIGFSMVLIAAFFSGIRWTLSQLIMQKSKLGLENPVDFIFHIQPLMILSLLPIAIGVEGTIKVNALSRLKIFLKNVFLLNRCGVFSIRVRISISRIFHICPYFVTNAIWRTFGIFNGSSWIYGGNFCFLLDISNCWCCESNSDILYIFINYYINMYIVYNI